MIDLGPLNTISVDPVRRTATVGAGAVWSAVLTASLAHGLTPPVFTDYIELSVGGTLSAGGVGGASHHHGAQVDTVVELEVVTGTGQIQTCSATRDTDLFHAALSGLGQVGVITRAVLRLVAAPTSVRSYSLSYPTVSALTAAQRKAVGDGRFDWLEGTILPDGAAAGSTSSKDQRSTHHSAERQCPDQAISAALVRRRSRTPPTWTSWTTWPRPSRP